MVSAGEVQGQLTWYKNIASTTSVDIQVVNAPTITFLEKASSVDESLETKTTVKVQLSESSIAPIKVSYAVSGVAEEGKDYTSAPNTLIFLPNETEQTLDITVIDDKLQEGDENVVVTLTDPDNAVLGSDYDVYTLTINDDDDDVLDMPVLSIDHVMATEGTKAISE